MSDSDAEFEKFLQESLSSSAASYISELSRSRNSSAAARGGTTHSGQKWHRRSSSEEVSSDHELEIAGQSWLKNTGPLGNSHAVSVNLTLPSVDYSKDSLEASKVDSLSAQPDQLSTKRESAGSDFQDTFSFSGNSASTVQCSTDNALPGLDTLQENADKERFFAELEGSHNIQIDYSELNRQLENTEKSSTASTTPVVPKDEDYSEDYEEDFEIPTAHSQSSLSSSHSTSTVTPTNSHSKLSAPSGTSNDGNLFGVQTSLADNEFHTQKMVETNLLINTSAEVNVSGSSVGSTQSVKRLLHRSSHSSMLQAKENPPEFASQSAAGFNLSPIHTQVRTDDKSMKGSLRHSENPGVSAHRSLSSEPEERHSLTLIYPRDLTTTGRLREHPQLGAKNQPTKSSLHSAGGFSLSPIHAKDSLVQDTRSDVGFGGPSVKSPAKLSEQSPAFSPIKEPSTYAHKGSVVKEAEMESNLPLHHNIFDKVPRQPHQLNSFVANSPKLDPRRLRNDPHFNNNTEKAIGSQFEVEVTEEAQSVLPDDSCVSDLTELQNALQAAGLPQISTVERKSGTADAPKNTQVSSLDSHTGDLSNVASTSKVLGENTVSEQVTAKRVDKPVTTIQDEMELPNQPSSVHRDEKHEAFGNELLASLLQDDSLVLQSSGETESQHDGSATASLQVQPDIETKGTTSVLRDAIRALANEELASITRDILRGGDEKNKSKEPLSNEHNPKLTDNVRKSSFVAQSPPQIRSHQQQKSTEVSESLSDKRIKPKRSSSVSTHQVEGTYSAGSMSPREGREVSESVLKQELSNILKSTSPSIRKKSDQKSLSGTSAPPPKAKLSTREARTNRFSSQPQRPQVKANTDRLSQGVKRSRTSGIPSRQSSSVDTLVRPGNPHHSKPRTSSKLTQSSNFKPNSSNRRVSARAKSATSVTVHASEKLKREDSSTVVIPTARTESLSELNASDGESCGHSDLILDKPDQAVLWQKAWQDEKTRNEQLFLQMKDVEERFKEKEKDLKAKFEEEQSELQQELYALSIKLKDLETSQDSRKLFASGRDIGTVPISKEEKAALQSGIQEQEVLLQGYQKENERLYSDLTKVQKELKSSQSHLYDDNQRLRKELLNARSELERLPHHTHSTSTDSQSSNTGAARISQLENKLETSNDKCTLLDKQVKQLKHTCSFLEQEVKKLSQEKREFENRARGLVEREEVNELKDKHKAKVSLLTQKLEWYTENQAQLDQDCKLMREKDKEIASLKEKISALEAGVSNQKGSSGARTRGLEARRVVQLERQVKELEKVIQKRFPNSLSALILASGGDMGPVSAEVGSSRAVDKGGVVSRHKAPPTQVFMDKRFKQLEAMLEERDKEDSKKLRALQQRYNAMELAYERKLTALKDKLQQQSMPTSIAADDTAYRTGQLLSSEASVPPSSNSFGRQRESVIQLESVASSRGDDPLQGERSNRIVKDGSVQQLTPELEELRMENTQLRGKTC